MKLSTQGLCTMLALLLLACTNQGMDELEHFGTKPKTNNTVISLEGLSFSLENEGELRYLRQDYGIELTKNSKGQIVPFPTFRDGQRLPLTVAIANRENTDHAYLVTSATYHAASKRLLIDKGEYKLSDFLTGEVIDSPDSLYFTAGQSYYISAVLGGSPIHSIQPGMETAAFDGQTYPLAPYDVYSFDWRRTMTSDDVLRLWDVRFEYNDILHPIQEQVGEAIDMTIAYATPWTELEVKEVVNEADGDYRVVRFTHKDLKFKPMGNIFVLQIGNLSDQDMQIEDIVFNGLYFGGHIPLNRDSQVIVPNTLPPLLNGVFSSGLARVPDHTLKLSNTPILKAHQRKQYTYYLWVTGYDTSITPRFNQDFDFIELRDKLGNIIQPHPEKLSYSPSKGYLKDEGGIFYLEMNITQETHE